MKEKPQTMSISQAAEFLGYSSRMIRYWIKEGKFKYSQHSPRAKIFIDVQSVYDFKKSMKHEGEQNNENEQ